MAKLPNRLVIEIAKTDKVDELGNPVISFESKDYAESVIEELEKIKIEIKEERDYYDLSCKNTFNVCIELIDKHIAELKGETE